LFEREIPFDTPKPPLLVRRLLQITTSSDDPDIIVDFFAGSCTTAQAALELNRDDGGNRKFIVVQLPETTGQQDYATIADIGKERIRRVIARLQEADAEELTALQQRTTPEDLGFKLFKLTVSNYVPWTGGGGSDPAAYLHQLSLFTNPLLKGWKPVNVLWEIALREGFGLTASGLCKDII
jgi:adenine-specific DNA-methyltransferase